MDGKGTVRAHAFPANCVRSPTHSHMRHTHCMQVWLLCYILVACLGLIDSLLALLSIGLCRLNKNASMLDGWTVEWMGECMNQSNDQLANEAVGD